MYRTAQAIHYLTRYTTLSGYFEYGINAQMGRLEIPQGKLCWSRWTQTCLYSLSSCANGNPYRDTGNPQTGKSLACYKASTVVGSARLKTRCLIAGQVLVECLQRKPTPLFGQPHVGANLGSSQNSTSSVGASHSSDAGCAL